MMRFEIKIIILMGMQRVSSLRAAKVRADLILIRERVASPSSLYRIFWQKVMLIKYNGHEVRNWDGEGNMMDHI